MAKPLRLPGIKEQRVRNEVAITLLLAPDEPTHWNQLVMAGHYLHHATLVGEPLR